MADGARLICASADLEEGGRGVRFKVEYFGAPAPAFLVRCGGQVHGYLNRCAHVALELDWREGEFFGPDGRDLLCSTHGATYAADTGRCTGGPCGTRSLVKLKVAERDGSVYYLGCDDD